MKINVFLDGYVQLLYFELQMLSKFHVPGYQYWVLKSPVDFITHHGTLSLCILYIE